MTYRKLFPALGLLEKANPNTPQELSHENIGNISLVDNSNSTESDNLGLKHKDALVFAQFSREDEISSSSSVSILVGDSDDETRIARVIGDRSSSVNIQYNYASSSVAIDTISSNVGLNIRKYYTNSNTATVEYGDGTYIFFLRTSI